MKVLLISTNKLQTPYAVYPIGLDYVVGAISPSHDVRVLDLCHRGGNDCVGEEIRDFQPDVVGLSLRNIDNSEVNNPEPYYEDYRDIVARIRQNSQAPIVLGGAGFNIMPDRFMEALQTEYGVVGDGGRLRWILQQLENGEPISDGPGVITHKSVDSPQNWSFDTSWTEETLRAFDPKDPRVAFYLKDGGMLNLQTTRGCPFHCIYCTYPNLGGKQLQRFEPKTVAEVALQLQQAGAKFLYVTDSSFNADIAHSLDVAEALKAAGVTIPWGAFITPIRMPKDYYKRLADCGFTHTEFGTDVLSVEMLRNMQKPFTIETVMQNHEQAAEAGLYIAHYFTFGGPGETEETLKESLDHAEELTDSVLSFFCGIRIYPHTRIYDIALQQGQVSADDDLLKPIFYHSAGISPETVVERVKERAKGRFNWTIGSGDERMLKAKQRMYKYGYTGPLWEKLIRPSFG